MRGAGLSVLVLLISFCFRLEAGLSANTCPANLSLMSSGVGSGSEESIRERTLNQLSLMYWRVRNGDRALTGTFELKVKQFVDLAAFSEGMSKEEVILELEQRFPTGQQVLHAQQEMEERKASEQAHFYDGLEPYLAVLLPADRKEVTDQLLLPRLVNPLITGEVNFRFLGRHGFLIGDESFLGISPGGPKDESFGPGDDFSLGQVPVAQLLYVLGAIYDMKLDPNPSKFRGGNGSVVLRLGGRDVPITPHRPVEQVTWHEAVAHAERVSKLTGGRYGLPSEKQWEFAARAGSSARYHFGDDATQLQNYAWFYANSGNQTHSVGELLPNDFRLYEMHGNVWEWTNSKFGSSRVFRGGGWSYGAQNLRSAYRDGGDPDRRSAGLGFRLKGTGPSSTLPSYTFTLGVPKPEAKPGEGFDGGRP